MEAKCKTNLFKDRKPTVEEVGVHSAKNAGGDKKQALSALSEEDRKLIVESVRNALKRKDIVEMRNFETFIKKFRTLRMKMGLNQSDVAAALTQRFGREYSQTSISRFENMILDFNASIDVRKQLIIWLNELQSGSASVQPSSVIPSCPTRRRIARTNFTKTEKDALEKYFSENKNPSIPGLQQISAEINKEYRVVINWFRNKRQKQRKNEKNSSSSPPSSNGLNFDEEIL